MYTSCRETPFTLNTETCSSNVGCCVCMYIGSKQDQLLAVVLISSWFWILSVPDVNFKMGINGGHRNALIDTVKVPQIL